MGSISGDRDTIKLRTYGRKRSSHKSNLSQSITDHQLWNQPEQPTSKPPRPVPFTGYNYEIHPTNTAVLSAQSAAASDVNKENLPWDNEPSLPQPPINQNKPVRPRPLSTLSMSSIKSSGSATSISSTKAAFSRMARALSSISNSSISSKGTIDGNHGGAGGTNTMRSSSTTSTLSTLQRISMISVGSRGSKRDSIQSVASVASSDISSSNLKRSTVTSNLSSILRDDVESLSIPGNSFSPSPGLSQHILVPIIPSNMASTDPKFRSGSSSSSHSNSSSHAGSPASYSSSASHSYSTTNSFLAFKKDHSLQHKKVDKNSISLPTAVVESEDHFSDTVYQPVKSGTGGHRSRLSVMSSLSSHSSLFSLRSFKSSSKETLNGGNYNTSTNVNSGDSTYTAQNVIVPTLSKRTSFSDLKRSIMSRSPKNHNSFFGRNGVPSSPSNHSLVTKRSFLGFHSSNNSTESNDQTDKIDKSMISLPTPVDTSREKLKNKLKASSSLLSLTRSDTSSSLAVAVPVHTHQQNLLSQLLGLCSSSKVVPFSQYVKKQTTLGQLSKLSEASYSEVFMEGDRVLKIIPFGDDELEQSPVQDIIQELSIAKMVMKIDGFVDVIDATIVQGRYPTPLLDLWDEYHHAKGSENYRPDYYEPGQLYCVIVLANAGTDLEHFVLESWSEALSIFWQAVQCLAQAEVKYKFEHRDLHWGNIVIKRVCEEKEKENDYDDITEKLNDLSLEGINDSSLLDPCSNLALKVTLIDYTLSRAANPAGGPVLHTRLDHPEFFRGKGDYQFDIYRFMRNYISPMGNVGNGSSLTSTAYDSQAVEWSVFCPKTNVLWLHYLAHKLLNDKGLERYESARRGRLSMNRSGSFSSLHEAGNDITAQQESQAYKSMDMVHSSLDPRKKRLGKQKGKVMNFQDFNSAQDVLNWGRLSKINAGI